MMVTWKFLSILSVVGYTEAQCSSTSYYRNCWIRRFPGLHVDVDESQRRGAQLLQLYRGDSAQNCSRTCCLTSTLSCNVAVFHYNTTQDSVNCFHLHCPTLQSCKLHHSDNVILYNVTKGMDPDLLIFGKVFPSNSQVLPHLDSVNTSDLSGTDKRHFNRPHVEPSSSAHPTILATSPKTSIIAPTSSLTITSPPLLSLYSTQDYQDTLSASAVQIISTSIITSPSTDPIIVSTTKATAPPKSTVQPMPQSTHTIIKPSQQTGQLTSSSTTISQLAQLGTTAYTLSKTVSTEFSTQPNSTISTAFSSDRTTTTMSVPFSRRTLETTTMPVPITVPLQRETTTSTVPSSSTQHSTAKTTTMPVLLSSTLKSITAGTITTPFPLSHISQSITGETTTMSVPFSSTLQSSTRLTTTLTGPFSSTLHSTTTTATTTVPLSSISQTSTGESTMPVFPSSTLKSSGGETTTIPISLSIILHSSTQEPTTMPVPLSSIPQSSTVETTIMPVPITATPQSSTVETTTLTAPFSSTLQSSTGETTTTPVPLSSIQRTSKEEYTTLAETQLSSTHAFVASSPLTPVKTMPGYVTTTTGPSISSLTTTSWFSNQPVNTQSTSASSIAKIITPSATTGGLSQRYTNINSGSTDASVTVRPTTIHRFQSINSGVNSTPTPPSIVEDSQPYPNDTKGHTSRNVTTGNNPQPVSEEGLTQVWHLAANTVLVALATCAALACGCCCTVLMAASWRGRRRRKGRYQTALRSKKGSMRLIKYVFVRESS